MDFTRGIKSNRKGEHLLCSLPSALDPRPNISSRTSVWNEGRDREDNGICIFIFERIVALRRINPAHKTNHAVFWEFGRNVSLITSLFEWTGMLAFKHK